MVKESLFKFIVQLQRDALKSDNDLRKLKQSWEEKHKELFSELIEIVDVFDNLKERVEGLQEHFDAKSVKYLKSYKKIGNKLEKILNKHGIKSIELFDKIAQIGLCEVIETQVSDQHEEGEIISTLKRGFQLEDRVLRPAQVITCRK